MPTTAQSAFVEIGDYWQAARHMALLKGFGAGWKRTLAHFSSTEEMRASLCVILTAPKI